MTDDRISKNLHLVYSALKSEGYTDIGDEQEFIKKMQDEQNRLKVYNALKGAGYSDMGSDFKSFSGMIYTAPQPKPQAAAAPVASHQSSPTTIQTNVVQPVVQTPATQQQPTSAAPREVKKGDGSMLMAPKQEQPSFKFNFTAQTYHGVPMLQNDEKGNPKVSGGTFNPVTGQYEGEGSFYTDWLGNKIPVNSDYGKAAVAYQQHVKDVSPINAELEEAYKERDRINKMLSVRMGEIDKVDDDQPWYIKMLREAGRAYAGDKIGGYGTSTEYQLKYNSDQQYRNIMSAARKNRAAIKALEDKKNGKQNEFWHAFGNAITNGYTFSQGDSDWGDVNALIDAQNHMPEIERKQKTGEKLTKDEEIAATVIKNHAWDNDVQHRYGDEYGAWARAGETAVGSLELGIDFLTMGPELKATAGSVMKLTEKGATKVLGDAATKGLGKYMTKATGVTVGSMIAGAEMSNTVGLNRTMSDVGKRYLGNVTVNEEDGSYQFDGGKGFFQSLYEAEMAASIENGSEVLGEFLPGSGILLKGLEKVGMKKVANGLTRLGGSTWYKNYTKALESIGFHGVGGEAVEEYAGLLGNALLVGDNKFSDLLDPKTHVDIWLGCAVTGGLLNAPRTVGYAAQGANKGYQAAQYYRYKHKTDKADAAANAVWGDEWVDLRDRIDGTRNEDMTDIATSIYTDADMTPEQKRTALDYIGNLTAMRGYNMGRISMEREDENGRGTTDDERSLNNAFAAGYNATEQEDMEDAKNAYDMHRQIAENSLDEWTLSALDGNETGIDGEPINPLHILGNMAYSPIVGDAMTDEQRKIAAEYLNAKARYDGMLQRVRDDIDSRISASDAAIDQRTNRVGLIQPATMKQDDRRVYVVDGNLVMHDDGSMIDVANSSESILVRDAETGKLEWASPHDFLSVDEEIDPAAEKEAAQAAIREQYAEEQAQKIDGALPFNDGDIYSVMEEDGTQWTAQILADNGDGTVQVAWNGNVNNPQTVSKDFVQELSTNAAMARLSQNEQEQAMQEQLDKEDEFQQERPVYNLNDEVTLRGENGEPVRGSITTEENEDGQIEVYTETPINGKKIHMFTRQQIDDMLMEHNGEAVVVPEAPAITADIDNAGAVQSEPSTVQNDVENVPNTDENVPASDETVAVEPMPMVGEGEDAEPDFGATTPQRAHDYIFNESGLEEADAAAFTKNNVEAANKELEKIKNKKPKMGTSIAKFNKDKAEWEKKVNEAQAKADYWKQVKEARDKVLTQRLAEQQERERQQIEQAQADEVAYREEMARKEAEQAALGTNNVSPAIRDKWVNAPKVEGAQDEIVLPNGEKVAGRYYLVESGAASASHDSNNGFAKTEGFPVDENGGSVNDRDYERDMDAQRITRDIANNYDSRAVQTPVVVSQDGVVLSGNGRTMAGELAAAQNTDAAYNSYIAQYPTKWGFTQQQVEGKQHPRVVFVPDAAMPYTAETFAKFNQQEMKGQSKTEQAVKLGKVVSDKAFNRIIGIINRFDTLGDFYADSKATSESITELQDDGVLSQAQMAEMYDGDGISAIGKELLENTLIGKAFESNPNAVREITEYKSMRQSIITALAEISNNLSLGKEYSMESELAQAIDLVYQARKGGSKFGEPVSWFARQQNLDFFGFSDTVADYNNATMLMIADIINDNRSSRLKKYLQIYNHNAKDSANGQLDLFTGSVHSKEDIINEVKQLFNNGSEEEQQKAAQEAVARRKAESVQENGTVANGSEAEPAGEVTTDGESSGTVAEEAPAITREKMMPYMQQFLMETNGDMRLLDNITDEELQKFLGLLDAWEKVNDTLGAAHNANDKYLNDKNKAIAKKAKEAIDFAEQLSSDAFVPVQNYYNELCDKYGITYEEEPAAGATGTDSSRYDEAKEFYRKNYSLQPLLSQLREQQRFVREGRGDEDVVRAILDILNEDYGNGEQNDLATAIAAAEAATEANPTDAQKEAGNYKKGHVKVDGFDITIENAKGSTRSGKDAYGKEWSVTMNNTYGYIRGTEGVDGDHIDIYLSDDPSNGNVFVIDQVKADGTFDEHKVMYGFASAEEARDNYLANYSEGWTGLGTISEVTKDEFKKWIESSHRKTKPFADYKNVKVEGAQNESAEGVVTPAAEKTDEQGNPLNEDETLKLEKLSSIDEITDEDLSKPTRSVELPALPAAVDEAIGANGKPVIIKKNIFERNAERHADLTADDSRNILQSALYNPNLYGQNQKAKRPYNWVVINTKDKEGNNRLVLIELSPEKENAEIVHWHYIDDKGLEKIKRQAEREDGQLLILPSESEEAGALSSPTNDLSSGGKVTNNFASDQENGVKSYKISAFEYTTKRGKKLNMQLVTFESELSKEQMNAAKKLAKDLKGWWSKDDGGFLMRDADSAQQLADSVFGDEEAVADAQPVTLEDMKLATAEPVAEQEEGFHGGDTVWSKQHGDKKQILMAHRMEVDGRSFVQSYSFTDGTSATAQEVEAAHEEDAADHAGTEQLTGQASVEEQKGSGNNIVTDERYEQLKARMRKKLGQLNVGVDPEMLAIGTEMAVYHIEKGARKFTEYAKAMIEDLGEAIRPYLKSFYNGARDLPEIDANGWTDEMTPYDEVRKIDVANFDKNTTNAMATADMVVKEEKAAQQAEAAKEQIIETRNNNRNEAEQQTETNTQAVADEAAAVASETESVISTGDAAAINEQLSKIDEQLENVNKQLALLGYYEADTEDPSKFHESYGYMKTAEKKAVADALTFSRRLCKALGMTAIPKRDVQANIAPIGGDVTFRIPLIDGKSLYFNIGLDNDHDNLSLSRIMYRVEEKQDGDKNWNSVGHTNNYLPNDVTVDDAINDVKRMLRYDAPDFEIKEVPASASAKQSKTTENKPKSNKKTVPLHQEHQLDLFGDLFADLNEQASETSNSNNNETTDVQSRTKEEGRGGQQPQQDAQVGRSAGHEAEGSDGRGMGGRSSRNSVSDGERSLGVSGTPQSQQHVEAATETDGKESGTVPAKNTNNNHAERGKDYAPKGVDARIEANIKAIELMQQLMLEGKQATPAQMKVLRQYSGWGGLGKAFNENPNGPYSYNPTTKRLKELLGDDAFRLAEDSRDSAFYTPAVVIDTMWDIARAMGFKGGTVLEGSAGIGNIIGAMPTDMSKRSDIHAVEIDETTGNILSLLYPDAKVDIQGFEQTKIANGSVDLAITNVPFVTGLNVRDESGDLDLSKKFRDIHDFCIAKNVRKLREGGIGIFITSNGTLDNSQKLRNWLVGEGGADVVGAFRLHNKTFGGAKVTSDIIVVRKRVNGQKSAHAIDVSTVTAERTGTFVDEKQRGKERTVSMDYNKYFMEHPECMAGEMFFGYEKGDNYRPSSKSLYPVNGKEQETMLAEWLKGFEGMNDEAQRKTAGNGGSGTEKQQNTVYESLGADVKEGSLILDKDGKLCVAQYGKAVPLSVNANKVKGHTKAECFLSYQAIKSALADVLAYQTENEGDEGLKPLLDKLNKAYDGFVKTYGHLHKNTSISFLKNDVDFPNILALEKHSEEGDKKGNKVDKFEKTDIFKQRVVEKDKAPEPKNVKDGIIASIYQYGRIDVPYIADKVGKSVDDVKQEIVSSGLGFENPNTLQMEVSYEYLSGNVREKLKQAEEANEGGKYAANIEALRKVIPMDIPAHLIDFTLGSSWVDPKLYEDFIKERTDVDAQLTNVGGTWYMKVPYYVQHEKNKAMGVRGDVVKKLILGSELIEAALQNKTITVSETHSVGYGSSKTTETITDKEATQACAAKIDEIRADFKEWARQKMQSDAEMSARIEKAYNEQFNNYVPVDVSMDFVPEYFGGANHKFKMREHQAKAIVRGTMQPLLLAHEVGTGKTFTLISTAMEMRRLGTAKKPMIVVQNATVGQFVASAKELYPNAKVLTLEDKDHTGEGRKNFYAKIKYNDWDMIVVPQSVFERIPDSEERQMRFIQDKIDEKIAILEQMREADQSGRSAIVRQAEKEIEQLKDQLGAIGETATTKRKQRDSKREHITRQNTEVKAREMLDRETDDVENFDDMGIDAILVDEAHEYKHLGFATAMQRGVKGIDPSYSKKSQGVYLKTQAVLEKNNGRNVIFATGTPISNTAAEIWTFMRYLMPADTMKDYGIYYFDDFVRNFGNLTQMLEFTTNGKFKENNRFAGYVNLPELVRIWSSVADTVRTDEAQAVKDNVPDMEGGQAQDIYLPQTRALRSIMKFVKSELERFEKMSGKEKKENSHIPLTMYGVAKAAAVDARLVMSDAEDDTNSKTNEAVRQTLKSLKETAKYKGTVALFADNYQNKHSGFNLYEDIREKLIAHGVPANEVVVIRSGMTIKKKQEIFDKVNRGEIRVILGSTFTLGTGVNIQERLHTLIHLDAPNRPMDYTQRNGRIVRQGNLHKVMGIPVRVLRFGVQDSLDVTAYQRLKTKGAIADSIMNGKAMMQNSMEDRAMEEDEDVFGDTVAQLSGSQYAMLKNQAEREVRKYESKRKQWEADQTYVHNAIPRITAQIVESERKAAENNANLAKIEEAFGGSEKPNIKVGKHTFADIAGMADFFTEQNKKVKETEDEIRKSAGEEQRTRTVDVQIGNATFTIKTTQKKELTYHGGTVDTKVSRSISISCPDLGIKDMRGGAYFKNAMENIFNDVVSGSAFREDAAYYSTRAERLKGELELVKSREGQPFQYDKELEDARQKYDEYTDLMKKEMEEKEKKYAEMDSDVEAATGITDAEEADEDSDSEVRFRDSLPNATAEDKDLRFSLRVDPAPNTSKTAYAVFIVKRHEDGSVSLHPKMLADEAVGAPPHTWLNADTGKIKRDKNGNPIENTRGRVSVRDAHGAPLAWRPGKHLAPYPNASQFAVEGDTKGVRDRLPDDVIFFEVEYAADRDYQLEAWEYGVNANGKYEHSQAGLPYIPKDGYYIYRTNANPNIPAMIITGAYRVKRALNDEEAKRLNQEAGGDWFDRKSGEPMTDERLKELGLDEAGLERKAQTFEYDELEPAHDESSVAMGMRGYVRRDLDFSDKNLLKAIAENQRSLKDFPSVDYFAQKYAEEKENDRQREVTSFEDGQVLPVEYDWVNDGYKVEGLNALYTNMDRLLDDFRNKYPEYIATMSKDEESIEVTSWRGVINDTRKPRRRNGQPTKAEQAKAAYIERKTRRAIDAINAEAKRLGLKVEVRTDTEGLKGRRARAKGWYDTKTGKIVIIIPNHTNGGDVMRTLLHEGVAHHGLRELFGEYFDNFLENVYNNVDEDTRKEIADLAAKKNWDFKVATEEYLASMAEDTDFERAMSQSWWHKIKFLFLEMLRKAGVKLDRTLRDADLRYILWRSYENLATAGEHGILRAARNEVMQERLGVGNYGADDNSRSATAEPTDEIRYRDGDIMDERDHAIVRDRYDRMIQSGMYQFREAMQDSMLSLRRLMEYISQATGEKVNDFENAYMAENALSSKNHAEQDLYGKLLFSPMLDEIHSIAKEDSSRDEVTRYMMAKHGLERNEVMAARSAKKDFESEENKDASGNPIKSEADFLAEYRERDFGGITGLMEEDDLVIAEGLAQQLVADFENNHDVNELWALTNACTKATLEKTYKAGLLSKSGYDEITGMYEYYIPLRGFDATTSDEVYSYLNHERSGFSTPLKKAEGRKSVADDPIATIANMADSAIVQGNRNMMKQKFLKFAMNHPSDAVSVNRMWLRYDDVNDVWEAVTAQIDENDTPDEVLQKTEQFEETMKQLAEADPDHYKRGKDAANIPYKTLGKSLNEHQVHVKLGGEDYILTINGSPRAAQALNGLTNPDNDTAGAVGAILKAGEYVNRQMSAFYTTRNPEFVLSNFLRDAIYANSTMWVRERPNYAIKFNKNFLKVNPKVLYGLIKKHNAGKLDINVEIERVFYQFMMNGGETGYTVVKDIDKQKKLIKKYVRMKDSTIPVEAAWQFLGDKLDDINRSVENCARFAAFLTSRQMGRTVERSVFDAKEVSVNFNKKGAGSTFMGKTDQTKLGNLGAFTSGLGRSFYVFWNAAVQGTTNFASLHKHHTSKALMLDAGIFLLGAIISGLGGGDDDDYWNLPSYVRRSNICFKIPFTDSFVSIPLGIEQRAIYGLGELFSSLASGRERMSGKEIAKEIAGSLSSMLPLDLMESNGDISWSTVSPSYVKPFVETANNKDWKGMPIYKDTPYNKDDPEWTKASKRTNQYLVDFSKWCNELTGGDEVKKGWLNFNPSKIEHVFEGVFGGVSTTANKLVKAGEIVAGKQDFDWSNILIASRVVKSSDENAEARRINAEYWKYYGEYKETKRLVDHYEDQDVDGIMGAAEKLDFMYNSPEYGRYEIVDDYYSDVKDLSEELNETTNEDERKKIETEINDLKREMVNAIRAYDDARK